MAHSCEQLGTGHRRRVYLDQTRLLGLLLRDDPEHATTARRLLRAVHDCDVAAGSGAAELRSGPAPKTPKRNAAPDPPVFAIRTPRDRYGVYDTLPEEVEVHAEVSSSTTGVLRNRPNVETTF